MHGEEDYAFNTFITKAVTVQGQFWCVLLYITNLLLYLFISFTQDCLLQFEQILQNNQKQRFTDHHRKANAEEKELVINQSQNKQKVRKN